MDKRKNIETTAWVTLTEEQREVILEEREKKKKRRIEQLQPQPQPPPAQQPQQQTQYAQQYQPPPPPIQQQYQQQQYQQTQPQQPIVVNVAQKLNDYYFDLITRFKTLTTNGLNLEKILNERKVLQLKKETLNKLKKKMDESKALFKTENKLFDYIFDDDDDDDAMEFAKSDEPERFNQTFNAFNTRVADAKKYNAERLGSTLKLHEFPGKIESLRKKELEKNKNIVEETEKLLNEFRKVCEFARQHNRFLNILYFQLELLIIGDSRFKSIYDDQVVLFKNEFKKPLPQFQQTDNESSQG